MTEGGATGGDRGTRILCALVTVGLPPFITIFFGGGDGLPGGFGATFGLPKFATGGLLGREGGPLAGDVLALNRVMLACRIESDALCNNKI